MLPLLATLLVTAAPQVVTEVKTGVSVTLPPMCMILPETAFNPKACMPWTAEEVTSMRNQLLEQATERSRVVAMGQIDGMRVSVVHVDVPHRRKGKMPASFLERTVNDMIAGGGAKPNPVHQIETFNGVTVLHVELVMEFRDTEMPSASWTVLTPTGDVTVSVTNGPKEKLLKLGREVMASLKVPNNMQVDLTGRLAVPE